MNFREQLLNPPEKQFPMNGSWIPLTPEKPTLIRSQPMSQDWQGKQIGRMNLQEIDVPGSGYLNEMLHYNGPNQNLHMLGLLGQTGGYSNFDGATAERNRIINHIAGSSTLPMQYDGQALNSNPLEVLLMKNATNIASLNRNLDVNISTAAARPLLPKHNQEGSGERDIYASGFMLKQGNYYSGSSTVYNDLNRLNIPSMYPEFDSGSSDSLLNNGIHCSISNPLTRSFCDLLKGGSDIPYISECDLNFAQVAETDVALSFTNFLQSMPVTLDQPNKFVDNQLCTVAESSSLEKDKHEILATSTENQSHKYCNGLLQHIVESSSAAISISEGENKGTESDNSGKGTGLGIDLNKTPEQKAPKRRKHRPKVITEGKPKRTPKPATQKKAEFKENPPKKRKYVRKNVPKEAATPQADITRENESSNATTLKSCRRALNFDLEKSRDQIQSKVVCQQEILQTDKAFDITSNYQAAQLHNGANTTCGTNSALLVSNQEALEVENQQYRNTEDNTLLLNQKLTDTFMPEEITDVALPITTEELQAVIDKDPDQGNIDLYQERANRCMQQYIHTKGIGNVHFLSETDFENFHMAKELMPQNSLRLVPNNLSCSTEGRGPKRKRSHGAENHVSATTQLGPSLLCQEIFQVDESCNGTTLESGFFKTQKRKKTKDRLPTKVCGRPNCLTSNNSSQEVRKKGKKEPQLQFNDETPNCRIERKGYDQKQKTGVRKHSGVPNQVYPALIDDIIGQLEGLNLGESNITEEGQNAIVPYKGDGSIVPFEEFDFAKKRKARPKVDLDPETERIWKLLMGKEGSLEGLEGTDKEKEKIWEEERKVFRGRVDSFIARMHLVQGDRRFSQWKGSVVDSVIGVFLTQNVSDHLSSSAFMSLAARFPLVSTSNKRASDIVGPNGSFEEPEVCIVNTDDTIISYGRLLSQPVCHHSFVTSHVTREPRSEASGINVSVMDSKNQISEDEIISSQDSLDSSITQGTGGIRSSSGSNSEAEGPTTGCKQRTTQYSMSEKPLHVEKTTMFQEFYNSVNGVSLFNERTKNGQVQLAEHAIQESRLGRNDSLNSHSACSNPPKQVLIVPSVDYELNDSEARGHETFQMNGQQPSWPETASIFSQLEETHYRRFTISEVGRSVDKSTEQQCTSLGSQELPTIDLDEPFSKHLIDQQNFSQSISHACHQQSSNHNLVDKICPEGTLFTDSESTSKKLDRGQDCRVQGFPNIPKDTRGFYAERSIPEANRQIYLDDSRLEPRSEEQVYSPGLTYKESKSNVSKAKKVKSESEKNNAVDWDNLRKQAQANGRKKERNKDTMDSLDYEAVRSASVKQISEAIKERGMNNMLAERIKEFLNRLVRDHGSIDLEWLRDVPPDKTKDYLLSIRGLGLKSVECVRLLTLHHLAFPVDTNVGRIAVRLGWVPLQPLPESLQLHLLELYPMLESIQKYLWPRLCKLDQRTLYELHYQMITFGKVFCTKSKPNCNACPMRAECRHFASAFASARLALPGRPEGKGIVNIPVPFTEQRNPVVNMNPMPLPPPEYNLLKEVSSRIGNCEPIIEEPATPEPECIESLQSDIEDSFYEDPDEIPIIKLNLETLSMNVRDYVQGNRELQECDMSKALVLLNQEAASIPAPKLKNVSRLRTEHQVYELPDSHPLLEKMDKREPDDPSQYLLAIWTPGETPNSIEPPERSCTSQDPDHMCNDNTCFACNSIREANSQTVRGTILIPCRTAMRGSFPLNGTYFQVNEVFADHASSVEPLHVPREWLWNLPRRTVYFGTSVSTIFKGLSTEGIQHCFWRGFVCVRGFDQQTRAPRPLKARLHFPASKLAKAKK